MTEPIKAIETTYAGCRFRSRIEARWAVFFDALSVTWEYESQGYELASGRYLCDFWLPKLQTWFEVKGAEPTEAELQLASELAVATGHRVIVASGGLFHEPNQHGHHTSPNDRAHMHCLEGGGGDYDYAWCICPWCDTPGIEYEGRAARIHGWQHDVATEEEAWAAIADNEWCWRIDDKCYTADHPRIHAAYNTARSARFEHGEVPRPRP